MPDDLGLLVRSGNRVILMETSDEPRAMEIARALAAEQCWPVFVWSITTGLASDNAAEGSVFVMPNKPDAALIHVRDAEEPAVYVFRDLGPHAKEPYVQRMIRDFHDNEHAGEFALILVESAPLPDAVRRFAFPFAVKMPDAEELEKVARETFREIKAKSLVEVRAEITKGQMEQLIQSLRGLTRSEARRVFASAVLDDHILNADDLRRVVEAKRSLLGTTGCLETIATDVGPDEIGGLENLKRWLRKRRGGLSKKAKEYGLDPPRGMLLLGVQGCGKSLCAKVVAADWNLPLLRLDPGVLYGKFVGESENRLRQALAQAEAMAPVVLWVDEIEKAFASAGADSADGGLSQRMFGTLLSWMQDHRHPIFMVATANTISALPPELMRKGRFDEIFFVDLPDPTSRARILSVHLQRRRRKPEAFDLARLAEASEGFSGAEIEQAIVAAMYAAFSEGQEVTTKHLLSEMATTRTLSQTMAERIRDLRAWAKDRCVAAD